MAAPRCDKTDSGPYPWVMVFGRGKRRGREACIRARSRCRDQIKCQTTPALNESVSAHTGLHRARSPMAQRGGVLESAQHAGPGNVGSPVTPSAWRRVGCRRFLSFSRESRIGEGVGRRTVRRGYPFRNGWCVSHSVRLMGLCVRSVRLLCVDPAARLVQGILGHISRLGWRVDQVWRKVDRGGGSGAIFRVGKAVHCRTSDSGQP